MWFLKKKVVASDELVVGLADLLEKSPDDWNLLSVRDDDVYEILEYGKIRLLHKWVGVLGCGYHCIVAMDGKPDYILSSRDCEFLSSYILALKSIKRDKVAGDMLAALVCVEGSRGTGCND